MNKQRHLAALTLAAAFLLGVRDGRLALWKDNCTHPEQIYDIRVDTLPPADRLALARGIPLESREDVWRILEDYLQ